MGEIRFGVGALSLYCDWLIDTTTFPMMHLWHNVTLWKTERGYAGQVERAQRRDSKRVRKCTLEVEHTWDRYLCAQTKLFFVGGKK